MDTNIRTPRRVLARRNGHFASIATLCLTIVIGGMLMLRHLSNQHQHRVIAAPVERAAAESQTGVTPPERLSSQMPVPAQDCGLVNGIERCFARPLVPDNPGPSAAERVDRALGIMDETRASGHAPRSRDSATRSNWILAVAERECGPNDGSIQYRHCRGRTWQRLRKACIADRERGDQDSLHCDAERRFLVPA